MSAPEPIFDRGLLARRRLRAVRAAVEAARSGAGRPPDFLMTRLADDLEWRLSAIVRHFDNAVVLAGADGMVANRLRALPNVGSVIGADGSAAVIEALRPLRPLRQLSPSPETDAPIIADEETLPFAPESLDLIVSALSLQWVNDLPGALIQIRMALKPDGLMLAAVMGGRTLFELREALLLAEAEIEGGASPRVAPFADVRDLGSLLQRARFALPVTDVDTVTVTYADPIALMRELRAMGATNVLTARRRTPLRRATLARAIEIYRSRHGLPNGRITATFEIVTLTGWAPHASQPKPLQPGSANTRLADALGTHEHPLPHRDPPGDPGGDPKADTS